jgi:alcohol dehydrogenase
VKALVYHGPGHKSWETVADPSPVEPTDIVVQVDTTTICGTDLHILKGDVPAVVDGRILGHEAVGTVVAVGSAVNSLAEGDRVLVRRSHPAGAAPTASGRCRATAWPPASSDGYSGT